MNGVLYVVYGTSACQEAEASIASLRRHSQLPVAVIGGPVKGTQTIAFDAPGYGARWAKLNADRLVPDEWDAFLYLDADTRIRADLSVGFDILADGWDVAMAASEHQERDWLWHVGNEERECTAQELGHRALQLQAGAMFVARNARTAAMFRNWRNEWKRWGGQDQAALLRAMRQSPVRVWLLSRAWNSLRGEVIEHMFGRARR